jgi:hypothetical protein
MYMYNEGYSGWRKAGALPVILGLLFLMVINLVFLVDTEVTIHRGSKRQDPGESQWTFGQTLALLLLSLPIRDTSLLEFYRRESKRREYIRCSILEFLRGIELGDVDTVIRFAGLQEVNVNMEVTTALCAQRTAEKPVRAAGLLSCSDRARDLSSRSRRTGLLHEQTGLYARGTNPCPS